MLRKQTILLADPDYAKHMSLARLLKQDFELLFAKDGIEAVRIYDKNVERVSAVIIDMHIPRLNGRAVSEWMLHIAPHLPIIITSDVLDEEALDLCRHSTVSLMVEPIRPAAIKEFLLQATSVVAGR